VVLGVAGSGSVAEDGTKVYLHGVKSSVMVYNLDSRGQGSGSVINLREGYVLTNWHVVENGPKSKGSKMLIVFPIWEKDRPVLEADKYKARRDGLVGEVVASSSKVDLAIIKLIDPTKIPKGTLPVQFASDSPLQGSKIYSIGNPGASDAMWIYTPGEVRSVYGKKWTSSSGGKKVADHDATIIEATSPTSPGDSGGPCFNDKMEQVGVTQGGLRSTVAQGFSYFIDSSEVKGFLKSKNIAFNVENDAISTEVKKDPEPKTEVVKKDPEPKTNVVKNDPPMKDVPMVDAGDEKLMEEKEAAGRLILLRSLAKDPSRQKFAITKLHDLVNKYPKTKAADEARELLKRIE
jgi:S1-C subfamily serine protease